MPIIQSACYSVLNKYTGKMFHFCVCVLGAGGDFTGFILNIITTFQSERSLIVIVKLSYDDNSLEALRF